MRKVSEVMTYREAIELRQALKGIDFPFLECFIPMSSLENLLGSLKGNFKKHKDLIQLLRKYVSRNQENTPIPITPPLKLDNCCIWDDYLKFLKEYENEF